MNSKADIDYGRITYYILVGIIVIALLALNYCSLSKHIASNSQSITNYTLPEDYVERNREAAVAGLFYPADKQELNQDLDGYLDSASVSNDKLRRPEILIVPHAGYHYSASVAAKAYLSIKPFTDSVKNVILVGPSHRENFEGAALSSADFFTTPLGKLAVNKVINNELAATKDFKIHDLAHSAEHSIEVQLPFLQKILPSATIVPIVYSDITPEALAAGLQPYLGRKDTLIIFSADLSHYFDDKTAKELDNNTAKLVSRNEADIDDYMSCGAIGINTALILAKANDLVPNLLDLLNSGEVSKNKENVVGYGAWEFSKNDKNAEKPQSLLEKNRKSLEDFKLIYGKKLMHIAEVALYDSVINHHQYSPSRKDYDNNLFNKGASFVTLKQNGELRGCIGSIIPRLGIAQDVADNAYAAALEDNRFKPLSSTDLAQVELTISLLTGFERIRYQDEADLLSQLNPEVDGVIIRAGDRQGLFLPSVWKESPNKQEFLNNLKLKAGMSPSYWSNKIKVYRFYTVEIKKNAN